MIRIGVLFTSLLLLAGSVWAVDKCNPELSALSPVIPAAHLHAKLTDYVLGMEKSALQKASFAALARPGRIADLGAGSGVSARDMALLFPDSQVVGVDFDPEMVKYARDHYHVSNLNFQVGDAEKVNFEPGSFDTIFMSSTTHHLTSFGSGKFDVGHVINAIHAAASQLKVGGLFILRDFLIPEGPETVILDLPIEDGTAALFERFVKDFRSSQHPDSGVSYRELKELAGQTPREGWRLFELSLRDATEFILRKDYRKGYDAEIKEEYTFMKQSEYENAMKGAGFRVLHSAPIYNPWIISNRFEGKVRLLNLDGQRLPFPATNYVIVGEKIEPGQGARIIETSHQTISHPEYLKLRAMEDTRTGEVYDLVERPGETVDLLPYFTKNSQLYVLGKQSFPRPILTSLKKEDHLTGIHGEGYTVEPINFITTKDGVTRKIEEELIRRAGIEFDQVIKSDSHKTYEFYTSPGLTNERARSVAIAIKSRPVSSSSPAENYSGLSSSGIVRAIEATQVLRSAQAGAVLDSRMEVSVYNLMLDLHRTVGPWIGDTVEILDYTKMSAPVISATTALSSSNTQGVFKEVDSQNFGRFLDVRLGHFIEIDSDGKSLAQTTREYVVPKTLSSTVVSGLPVARVGETYYVGLEKRQLPTVQFNESGSDITTAPAWRLSQKIRDSDSAKAFAKSEMQRVFNTDVRRIFTLGGPYHPSPGVSPETIHPFAFEVDASALKDSKLMWVPLDELVAQRSLIKDGHLLVSTLRLAHALGLLP